MTIKSIDGLSWRWDMKAGRQLLVTDGAGSLVILAGQHHDRFLTRDLETGVLRPIDATDQVAKIIGNAPDVRRHAQSLINGIDLGLLSIETDADESCSNVLTQLRLALAKSGAK